MHNSELILPSSYEDIVNELNCNSINEAMMQFFIPVVEAEEALTKLSARIRNSGKLSLVVGRPGVGKSTFFQSLSWRAHVKISGLKYFDAQEFIGSEKLIKLTEFLNKVSKQATERKDTGPLCVIINYLENLSGINVDVIKGFFRDLNGILRKPPILVLWPLTESSDAEKMFDYSNAVSGTLFQPGFEKIEFNGPFKDHFTDIATKTIEVINQCSISDFNLNTNDLEGVYENLKKRAYIEQTIRNYLDMVKIFWDEKSNHFKKIKDKMPKPNEVWFVFAYKDAENVTKEGANKRGNSSRLTQSFHFFMFEPFFLP